MGCGCGWSRGASFVPSFWTSTRQRQMPKALLVGSGIIPPVFPVHLFDVAHDTAHRTLGTSRRRVRSMPLSRRRNEEFEAPRALGPGTAERNSPTDGSRPLNPPHQRGRHPRPGTVGQVAADVPVDVGEGADGHAGERRGGIIRESPAGELTRGLRCIIETFGGGRDWQPSAIRAAVERAGKESLPSNEVKRRQESAARGSVRRRDTRGSRTCFRAFERSVTGAAAPQFGETRPQAAQIAPEAPVSPPVGPVRRERDVHQDGSGRAGLPPDAVHPRGPEPAAVIVDLPDELVPSPSDER
mmetsp:Transcript_44995/g.137423  ORF Transcript_44995/g.137423 Transcript_44995/m.137423 type:complete len:299 (-) Transcript_44995:46-942(-)